MGLGFKVTVDAGDVLDRLRGGGFDDCLERITREIEGDMRPYVKRDTGTLEGSAALNSDFRRGRIVWTAEGEGGEYAGYAFDDPAVGTHAGQNPKATARWTEVAKKENSDRWRRLASRVFAGDAS